LNFSSFSPSSPSLLPICLFYFCVSLCETFAATYFIWREWVLPRCQGVCSQ
jgi:hypothetical protein